MDTAAVCAVAPVLSRRVNPTRVSKNQELGERNTKRSNHYELAAMLTSHVKEVPFCSPSCSRAAAPGWLPGSTLETEMSGGEQERTMSHTSTELELPREITLVFELRKVGQGAPKSRELAKLESAKSKEYVTRLTLSSGPVKERRLALNKTCTVIGKRLSELSETQQDTCLLTGC